MMETDNNNHIDTSNNNTSITSSPNHSADGAAPSSSQPSATAVASSTNSNASAALAALLSQPSLTAEQFDTTYAPILRECQKSGDCSSYDWTAIRHLLALRFQQVYQDFRAASETFQNGTGDGADEFSWMCAPCKAAMIQAKAAGTPLDSIRLPHCRRSEEDEEPMETRYQRMMHMLIAFYKPPFTFQRMCDLLLEPKRYYKNTAKFMLAFSKLVCGINCDTVEEPFNINWSEQKEASLGLPQVQFVTREEDEFLPSATTSTATTAAGFVIGNIATHAILPPQQYRVGMTAAELSEAAAKEATAREAIEKKDATRLAQQKQEREQKQQQQQNPSTPTPSTATTPISSPPSSSSTTPTTAVMPTTTPTSVSSTSDTNTGAVAMEMSD